MNDIGTAQKHRVKNQSHPLFICNEENEYIVLNYLGYTEEGRWEEKKERCERRREESGKGEKKEGGRKEKGGREEGKEGIV